jgi:hypothetical protein
MPKGNPSGEKLSKREKEAGRVSKLTSEKEAAGQYVRTRHGSTNSGVISANPRVISKDESGDATNKRSWND